jgi:hypothetical protein
MPPESAFTYGLINSFVLAAPNLADLEVAKRNQASKRGSRHDGHYIEFVEQCHHD